MMGRKTRFRNREHAGVELSLKLQRYSGARDTIVVGLARGGVAVAAALSEQLNLPWDVFVSRKLSSPEDRQRALGAVTETGFVFIDEAVLSTEPWPPHELRRYIEEELQLRKLEIARRCACYRCPGKVVDFRDQTVIAVDEGAFTGTTFVAALQSLRMMGARYLVGGLPVAPKGAIRQIWPLTDELVVLRAPAKIEDLGDYYDELRELSDEETVNCLATRAKVIEVRSTGKRAA
jgi:putative phosphoribosyl transferase